ncbi:related to NGG1-interacting factor 3 [Saccharomycodes ludwigii]|uniref:Related to NGG1-interacting factor 3 n=1 Tax=Saccharomycodes ludwigii TaxID=36035 RepID=A0A376B7D9_9ASCO|nr:hypothetical protein SCDLUD_002302 [Saccharomycodes ludwigii]KAH3900848.1 hypothetical protein SCDLUD_002302 [Saccharomycodes ludwigii]SSD60605.1 related to NGG1-interacting factor 3 [Saccharomycodes ludwigii]
MPKQPLTTTELNKIVKVIQSLYPIKYADSKWDNTGLLIDTSVPSPTSAASENNDICNPSFKVLLTNDLTSKVCDEAISRNCNLILAYHPFIFPSWKNISPNNNPQHKSCIKLIQKNISVYCPHTSVDAVPYGVNDWLCNSLVGVSAANIDDAVISRTQVIEPIDGNAPATHGYGRIVELVSSLPLNEIIGNIKSVLKIKHVQVAVPTNDNFLVKRIALCAGSGSGVFRSISKREMDNIDLIYTGELSHHEILKFKEMGKAVVLCNHSNTERQYIKDIMTGLLSKELNKQNNGTDKETLNVSWIVSETDEDPLVVV